MNPALSLADSELHARLLRRDASALEPVYERYGGIAYGLALRIVGDSGRAEEVVQDVMTKLWTKPDRFDPQRGSLRTWVLTVVRNRAIDVLRRRDSRDDLSSELAFETPDRSDSADPWRAVSLSLERSAVREAMGSLSAEQRQAIELAFFAGYSHSEIAERLNLPLGTVKGDGI
jgi:RNA polymerase sigma-70 factor (ECF subfamily)